MNKQYSGSCLCGQVKFQMTGAFDRFYLCHCKFCQKDTGSAHAANLFSSHAQLIWNSGAEKVKNFNVPGTRHTKSFCTECGSALPNQPAGQGMLVVPAGCLDIDLDKTPDGHLFWSSKANWEQDLMNIKKFEKLPTA
jgi:hypothetical protein